MHNEKNLYWQNSHASSPININLSLWQPRKQKKKDAQDASLFLAASDKTTVTSWVLELWLQLITQPGKTDHPESRGQKRYSVNGHRVNIVDSAGHRVSTAVIQPWEDNMNSATTIHKWIRMAVLQQNFIYGVGTVAQRVKPPLRMPTFHIRMPIQVLAIPHFETSFPLMNLEGSRW